jgi:hypothetical protein
MRHIFDSSATDSECLPCISKAQACRNHERVRAATAAETILAASIFASPMFSASPAMNSRASSLQISTEEDSHGALLQAFRTKSIDVL